MLNYIMDRALVSSRKMITTTTECTCLASHAICLCANTKLTIAEKQKGMHLLSHQYHISNHVAAEVIKFYYSIPTSSSTRVVNTSSVTEVFLGFSCTGTLITGIGGGTGWGDITN